MKTLKDFIGEQSGAQDTRTQLASLRSDLGKSVVAVLNPLGVASVLTKKATESEFSSQIASVATSPQFIEKLSEDVGSPKSGESEDQFVARAKASLRKLLAREIRR